VGCPFETLFKVSPEISFFSFFLSHSIIRVFYVYYPRKEKVQTRINPIFEKDKNMELLLSLREFLLKV
jgi:hypothetical protein